ncbi:MAG: prephenate dehydrogenase [Bacillota bacterium]
MNITIVGLGLIGGSIAKKLKDTDFNVFGIDKNKLVLKKAIKKGIINKTDKDKLKIADILIVCLYPKDTVKFIKNNKDRLKKDVLITDVSGVKGDILKRINKIIDKSQLFIPAHPMAGREEGGFNNSEKNLFVDANYLVMNKVKDKRYDLLKEVVKSLEAKFVEISIDRHDKMIGLTSQLPHIIASAVTRLNKFDDTKKFVGNSFNDVTRVSLINEDLWSELFLSNKEELTNHMINLKKEMDKVIKLLEKDDKDLLEKYLLETRKKREEYLKNENFKSKTC